MDPAHYGKGWSEERAYCPHSSTAFEMHAFSSPETAFERISEQHGTNGGTALRADKILPFIAEKYGTSRDLKDYAAVPVIIMPSDLPNRNKVGFPYRRLTEFDTHCGMLGYQTWRNMPTHTEHANTDYTVAKGLVLDVGMRPMRNAQGDIWKVNALLAFDRSRDPDLVNQILTKRRTAYSMGAYVSHYACSICGAETANKMRPSCDHINPTNPRFDVVTARNGQRRLAHWCTGPFKGFEVSSVGVPAYTSAVNPDVVWGGEG